MDEKILCFACFRFLRFDMTPLKSDFIYDIYIRKPWIIKDLQPIHDLNHFNQNELDVLHITAAIHIWSHSNTVVHRWGASLQVMSDSSLCQPDTG